MAASHTLSMLRNGMQEIYREVLGQHIDGEVANDAVLEVVRARMVNELTALTPQLVNMQLTKILNDLGARKRGSEVLPDQIDLFGEYQVPRFVSVARGKKKDIKTLTVAEAKIYLDSHSRRSAVDRHAALRRLVEDCLPFSISDLETLGSLIEKKRKTG